MHTKRMLIKSGKYNIQTDISMFGQYSGWGKRVWLANNQSKIIHWLEFPLAILNSGLYLPNINRFDFFFFYSLMVSILHRWLHKFHAIKFYTAGFYVTRMGWSQTSRSLLGTLRKNKTRPSKIWKGNRGGNSVSGKVQKVRDWYPTR